MILSCPVHIHGEAQFYFQLQCGPIEENNLYHQIHTQNETYRTNASKTRVSTTISRFQYNTPLRQKGQNATLTSWFY